MINQECSQTTKASYADCVKRIVGNRQPFANLQNHSNGNNYIRCRQQEEVNVAEKENMENALHRNTSVSHFSDTKLENEILAELPDFKQAIMMYMKNPAQLNGIYVHMKELENSLVPLSRKPNNGINQDMRSSFINWLVFTTETFNFDSEILHLAASYADNYIFTQTVGVENLLLVGTSAFFIACKHEESRELLPDMDALIKHTSRAFTKREVLKMEQNLLKALDFRLFYPTAYQFLLIFCCMCKLKEEEICLSLYLCDLALIYEELSLCMKPSKIAAISIALSIYLLSNETKFYDIEILSGYNENGLKCAATLLLNKLSTTQCSLYKNLINKYSSSKFKYISLKKFNTQHIQSTYV